MQIEQNNHFFILDYETTGITRDDVPIELGFIITDSEWNELARDSFLIKSPEVDFMDPEHYQIAQQIHGIPQQQVFEAPVDPFHASTILEGYSHTFTPKDGRLILLSDNIQFEWYHSQWILNHNNRSVTDLFHYCGWDTSILSLFTSFQDPRNTKHRALSDVEGLLEALRKTKPCIP